MDDEQPELVAYCYYMLRALGDLAAGKAAGKASVTLRNATLGPLSPILRSAKCMKSTPATY